MAVAANPVRTLTLTRILDAPREMVFRAWTDPVQVQKWWGPKDFTNPICEWNAKPGGKIRVVMRASDEIAKAMGFRDSPMGGEFHEVDPPKRLVFTTTAFEDDAGNAKLRNLNTVTFEEQNGKTKMTLHVEVQYAAPEMAAALDGMEMGWSQSLDKLADLVARA